MSELMSNCEYSLIEYAPSALRETRIAVGLMLFNASGELIRQGFTEDWRRIRCLDPQADLGLLGNLAAYFEGLAHEEIPAGGGADQAHGPAALYERLLEMHREQSGSIQVSPLRGVQTADPQQEFGRLFREHVETLRSVPEKRPAREGSRSWLRAHLSEAIHRHGLWERFSKDVPVAEFTAPGDSFRIDFAYRPNGVTNYLHAISLERDWNQSKLLSYTFWKIREKSEARMTAIVADANADTNGGSCREILAGAQIALQPLALLDPYLERVSRELRHN